MAARTRYSLSFPLLDAHLVDVEARFSGELGDRVDLEMAAWTPGSYLIREYARHIQDLTAAGPDGRALPVAKIAKATWRVETGGIAELTVRYRVYGWDLSVRTNHIDASHAFLNGAPTFLWIADRRHEPIEVVVEAPAGWRVSTGLPGDGTRFTAADLDELVDSPFHLGRGPVLELQAAGKPASIAVWGHPDAKLAPALDPKSEEPRRPPLEQLAADTAAIIETHARVFGGVPYERYAFFLMLSPGAYGGLEHRASAALLSNPFAFATRKAYEELLELVSHEYFHLWNVKRIHPRALGPFDYKAEAYTRSLWVMEGVTSYYDRYALRRAGLMPVKRYFERTCEDWAKYVAIPGRAKQSLEESSFDAWIKLYRPDENSVNSTISYYLKGSLVAFCLDLEIRRRSGGRRSMDDVLRRLWERYGKKGEGFEDADVEREFSAAVDLDLGEIFRRSVRGREDPDLAGALASAGLELKPSWAGEVEGEAAPAWLGMTTRGENGRPVVSGVLTGSPAQAAGVYAGDELLALDGFKLEERGLEKRLNARKPGEPARLALFRRDELLEVNVILGERPRDKFEIVGVEEPGEAERKLHLEWLGEKHPKSKD